MTTVYVLNKENKPLMPTTRCHHVRWLLKQGKAKVVGMNPFTIKLLYNTPDIVQPLYLGIDPGRTNIGVAVVKEDGEAILVAKVETRNKDVKKLMEKRKGFRGKHRQNKRRKKRQRRAKANNTVKSESFERTLPHYEKPITCKFIKNKEARFLNRKREKGWLTPTANQLLQTHLSIIEKFVKILPIKNVVLELNKFAFMQLDNIVIKAWEYQNGPLKGYNSIQEKVNDVQDNHCLLCNDPIKHYHHIVPRHNNGSNTVINICGLCENHHTLVHTDDYWKTKLEEKTTGLAKKYGGLGVLNQIFNNLIEKLSEKYNVHITDGKTTYNFRKEHDLLKDHDIDAYCIACSALEITKVNLEKANIHYIRQYRRHDRQACNKENINRRYKLDGKIVATNRHRAFEQKEISLEEYINNHGNTYNLEVLPHKPVYKRMDRIMPGAIFLVNGKRKVLKGSSGLVKGHPYEYNFEDGTSAKYKDCTFLAHNTGLAFLYYFEDFY